MTTHEDASGLLAAFALDAMETDERVSIEIHLLHCPRCRSELDAFRYVAAAMGNSVEPLPEGLWDGISRRLPERQDQARPPVPRLLLAEFSEGNECQPVAQPWLTRTRRIAMFGTFVGAAAAAAAVLGIGLIRADRQVSNLQAMPASDSNAVVMAFDTPGHKVINLQDANHLRQVRFVLANGRGYLVSSHLPALSSGQTYQLWGDIYKKTISLGLLGQSPSKSTFTLAGTTAPTRIRITIEPVGGSIVPSSTIVASGTV